MLQFLKRLFFRKPNTQQSSRPLSSRMQPSASVPMTSGDNQAGVNELANMQAVETASLSLAAIVAKLPDDLKKLLVRPPSTGVMVALPLKTILKQLPSGSVKMTWASVVRQAPPGTFSIAKVEDKRLVDVPLVEIFKRVNPALLRRRDDQKMTDLADEGFDIFGDDENPRAVAPVVKNRAPYDPQQAPPAPAPAPAPQPAYAPQPAPRMGGQATAPFAPQPPAPMAAPAAYAPPPTAAPAPQAMPRPLGGPSVPTLGKTAAPVHTGSAPPPSSGGRTTRALKGPPAPVPSGTMDMALAEVCIQWAEPFRSEAMACEGAIISLPAAEVGSSLQKGRVAFTWGQIRSWMNPPPAVGTAGEDGMELVLPLKVIAPAFMRFSKGGSSAAAPAQRKGFGVDDAIPDLFSGGPGRAPAPEPVPEPAAPAYQPPPPVAPPQDTFRLAPPQPAAPVYAPAPAPVPAAPARPATVGEILGQPSKAEWQPSEIVREITKLRGVAGAIIALQEGFAVASNISEPYKADVLSAFMPQVFGRLNQYSAEMQFGTVDSVIIGGGTATHHLYRFGQVYFAVLGRDGETPPTQEIGIIAAELAKNQS